MLQPNTTATTVSDFILFGFTYTSTSILKSLSIWTPLLVDVVATEPSDSTREHACEF